MTEEMVHAVATLLILAVILRVLADTWNDRK